MDLGFLAFRPPRGQSSLGYFSDRKGSGAPQFSLLRIVMRLLSAGESRSRRGLAVSPPLDLSPRAFLASRQPAKRFAGRLPGRVGLRSLDPSQRRTIPSLHSHSFGLPLRTLDGQQPDLRRTFPRGEPHHPLRTSPPLHATRRKRLSRRETPRRVCFPSSASRPLLAACRSPRRSLVVRNAHSLAGLSANRFRPGSLPVCRKRRNFAWHARRVTGSHAPPLLGFSPCRGLSPRISFSLLYDPGFSASSPSVRSHPRSPPGRRRNSALDAVLVPCKRLVIAVHFRHPSSFGIEQN